ncbi:MAG: HAMP domain-containing sensor histidine kinase [Myxococcota bacterium]
MGQPRQSTPRFRKVFVVFMILVAAPSLAISGFGIMAILDAREVAEARLRQSSEVKLRLLEADLSLLVEARNTTETPSRAELLQQVRQALPELVAKHFPGSGTTVEITNVSENPQQGWDAERAREVLRRWVEGQSIPEHLLQRDVVAELPLAAPLQGYHLQAKLVGDDLLAAQVRTTAALYIMLLSVFYVLLILGVVLVSMSMYREVQLGRLKTDFVSHVSHELRTPLTSIRMFLETLLMDRVHDEKEKRECLEMCARETERLSGMIERVLDWAKIEAGKRPYTKRAALASDVVERAVTAFGTQALEAPYQLTKDIQSPDARIMVDVDALGDALLNLLHNAFKYTGTDKRIEVRVAAHGRWVDLSVKDNGVGVLRTEHRRIFERFYRAEDLLTQRTHGSGLGLALAKRIVEAHGGKILLRSQKGVGSTFTLRLPRIPDQAPATAAQPAPQA